VQYIWRKITRRIGGVCLVWGLVGKGKGEENFIFSLRVICYLLLLKESEDLSFSL